MKITSIRNTWKLIKPELTMFNKRRVVYEIGQTTMYADAGHGIVQVSKDGVIRANGLKGLGVCTTGQEFIKTQKIIIKDSDITAGISKRKKDKVLTVNCTFPKPKQKEPKVELKAEVVYTNRP